MSISIHLVLCVDTWVMHDYQSHCHQYQALGYQMHELSVSDTDI